MSENEWAEPLPANCPPAEAKKPTGGTYYRVTQNPPREEDFDSFCILFPERVVPVNECEARSCSLFDELTVVRGLLNFRKNKGKIITRITLPAESGVISKTGRPNHWSWWRRAEFQLLAHCEHEE
ncbi:MAG: hypothetical protein P4L99_04615 [Chthoniobacter sp.]|nr:hypothetical protein [Chthoniobacter sp.]